MSEEQALGQLVQQVIAAWQSQNKAVTDFFNKYEDSRYLKEIAPGLNRPVYLLGHLIAVSDGLHTVLGIGERMFPRYEQMFLREADKAVSDIPSVATLKEQWNAVNASLESKFGSISAMDWMSRHMSVSEEDFQKNTQRNKINVLMNRTAHQAYHVGQLILVK